MKPAGDEYFILQSDSFLIAKNKKTKNHKQKPLRSPPEYLQ